MFDSENCPNCFFFQKVVIKGQKAQWCEGRTKMEHVTGKYFC